MALALSGCSARKEAKLAEAKAAAMRVRTDSLRKARHLADSLAQVRYASCADSVRTELTKVPEVIVKKVKSKARKQKPPVPPSEELIAAQAQQVCGTDAKAPLPKLASDSGAAPAAAKAGVAVQPAAPKADSMKAPAPVATKKEGVSGTDSMSAAVDQAVKADSMQKAKETEMYRETFAYSGSIRDPFNSLLNMAKAGPEVADLQLVGIYQNMRVPSGSVAVFREKEGGKRHKLRAGDQLGRSRVVQIRERDVVFIVEDFGFERQETLSLRKQEDVTP
jgi:hypothetical protein